MNLRCFSSNTTVFLSVFYELVLYSSSGGTLSEDGTVLTASVSNNRIGEQLSFDGSCFSWSDSVSGRDLGTGESISISEEDFGADTLSVKCVFEHPDSDLKMTELISIDREAGASYTILIHSSNGNIFRMEKVNTTLSCQVLRNNDDITDSLEDYRFNWKRNTGNDELDKSWANSSKAIAKKQINITQEDCLGRTVFSCEVDI